MGRQLNDFLCQKSKGQWTQKPEKPNEIEDYEKLFRLQFQMPNTWQNIISDKIRIVAAFVPIDGEHTHIYLRYYQNLIKLRSF